MTTDDGLRDSGNGIDGARETDGAPDPSPAEARVGASPVGQREGPEGDRPTLPLWSVLSDRVRREVGSSGAQDALIWTLLIAVLGVYGWLTAGLRPDVEEAPAEVESRVDTAIQPVAAERPSLERQIAEARARIDALEETLKAERRQGDAAGRVPSDAPAVPRGLSSLVAELGGRETERGILLDLDDSDLSFPIGKASLPDRALPILDRIADLLVQHPTLTARVEGHTDSAGRDEANLTLSQARADAVKGGLAERGVSAQRIEAIGYGETRPIADNGTRAGRDRNRRIEVYLIDDAN